MKKSCAPEPKTKTATKKGANKKVVVKPHVGPKGKVHKRDLMTGKGKVVQKPARMAWKPFGM